MKLHSRQLLLQQSVSSFGLACMQAMENSSVNSWADGNLILNRLDSFWIKVERAKISIAEAEERWNALNFSSVEFPDVTKNVGDKLLAEIKQHSLTAAEINVVLTSARSSDAKYQLRE
jgi:hypothetical protein